MSVQDQSGPAGPRPSQDAERQWWRTVLGEYPTGVTLVTSLDDEGEPVAMVVGTFAAVSQDPPLVGFMPANDSTTYPVVARRGRFVANVLGATHEHLCRAFSRKLPNRFSEGTWVPTASGIPRLADAVAWFDATIEEVHPAGDHSIVVANVEDFGVGEVNAGLPLLYLRGGYGSFTVPSLHIDAHGYARQLKSVDLIRDRLRAFAEEHDIECVVCGLAGSSVVVLHAANMRGTSNSVTRPVGVEFPFTAPLAPSFAAWGSHDTVRTWIESSRHLLGSVDRAALTTLLNATRERGFAVSRGSAIVDEFSRVVTNPDRRPTDLAALWSAIAQENAASVPLALDSETTSVQIPVFGQDGFVELVVVVSGLTDVLERIGPLKLQEAILQLRSDLSHIVSVG